MIELPQSYERQWPDQELVVMDALTTAAAKSVPAISLCTWLPEDAGEQVRQGAVFARVARLPGGFVSDSGVFDTGTIQLAVYAPTRQAAWDVLRYLEMPLLENDSGGEVHHLDGSVSLVAAVRPDDSPTQIPDDLDARLVVRTYLLTCRKNRG